MKLLEFEGKKLFREYGINIPKGIVTSGDLVEPFAEELVLKAQVYSGGRGKAGGIVVTDKDSANEKIKELFSRKINDEKVGKVLVEEKIGIDKELYLSITIDRARKRYVLAYSGEGGVDIEEVARVSPDKVKKLYFYEAGELDGELDEDVLAVSKKLFKIMKDKDAELVEINPLVRTGDGRLVAADSKVIIDDNALYRQGLYATGKGGTDIERKAAEYGLQYVELDGDIAIIGNGAGLVMATLDVLSYYGGTPANFLDVGGGASAEVMMKAIEVVQMKKPKGILVNIFGGITRCDEIAKALAMNKPDIPMAVRMIGTNETEGKEILRESGISSVDSMEECAKEIVRLCQ